MMQGLNRTKFQRDTHSVNKSRSPPTTIKNNCSPTRLCSHHFLCTRSLPSLIRSPTWFFWVILVIIIEFHRRRYLFKISKKYQLLERKRARMNNKYYSQPILKYLPQYLNSNLGICSQIVWISPARIPDIETDIEIMIYREFDIDIDIGISYTEIFRYPHWTWNFIFPLETSFGEVANEWILS